METIPWAVGGGITSPSIARMLAYQATGGAEGVAGIGDFVVRQQAVAGNGVRIGAGGGVLVNRYPGARNESYMCRAGDETVVPVLANVGSNTRYDLVVARVDDWNMAGGQATPDTLPTADVPAAKFEVIWNVGGNVKTAKELNLNYPAIALARIAIPAATQAITQAMITDLREMAVPRRKRDLRAMSLNPGQEDVLDDAQLYPIGESWPNQLQMVEIPDWATEVRVIGTWAGVLYPPGGCTGSVWVKFGYDRADKFSTQNTLYDSTTSARGDYARETLAVADTVKIPASMRGQSVYVGLWGNRTSQTTSANAAKLDAGSSVYIDLEFIEAPSEDL